MNLIITNIILFLISVLDRLITKNYNYVVYNSFPDLSDNSFALFLYTLEHYPEKSNIWLIKKMDTKRYESLINKYTNRRNYKLVKRDSIQGIYYYLRAKYVFFTHGLFAGSNISKQHCVVNLWHGMPLKKIGLMEKNEVPQNSKFAIATSFFLSKNNGRCFGYEY